MAGNDVTTEPISSTQSAPGVNMKLEVVTLPVSNVDRAKSFYQRLGWRLDADFDLGGGKRVVQFTPPHSQCSIAFGTDLTTVEPGSALSDGSSSSRTWTRRGRTSSAAA